MSEFDVKQTDFVELLAHDCLHNGQHPVIREQCVHTINEWKQMAENDARIFQLLSNVLRINVDGKNLGINVNFQLCVSREQALNSAEEVEHLIVELA